MSKLIVQISAAAERYIAKLSAKDKARVMADIKTMADGDIPLVHTKQLKGRIRELISGPHRITYFSINQFLWFVRGFRKTTGKTPKGEIEYAEEAFNAIKQKIK